MIHVFITRAEDHPVNKFLQTVTFPLAITLFHSQCIWSNSFLRYTFVKAFHLFLILWYNIIVGIFTLPFYAGSWIWESCDVCLLGSVQTPWTWSNTRSICMVQRCCWTEVCLVEICIWTSPRKVSLILFKNVCLSSVSATVGTGLGLLSNEWQVYLVCVLIDTVMCVTVVIVS